MSVVTGALAVVSSVTLGIEFCGLILHGEGIKSDDAAISAGGTINKADGSSDKGVLTSEVLEDDAVFASFESKGTSGVKSESSTVDGTSSGVLIWVGGSVFVDLTERVEFITNHIASSSVTNETELIDRDSESCIVSSREGTSEKDGLSWELSELDHTGGGATNKLANSEDDLISDGLVSNSGRGVLLSGRVPSSGDGVDGGGSPWVGDVSVLGGSVSGGVSWSVTVSV